MKKYHLFFVFILFQIGTCLAQTITDYDGNTYNTIVIGNQTWMKENLKVTHYQSGEPILSISDDNLWFTTKKGAMCDYANLSANSNTYGKIYNFYAVSDTNNICPFGWHVPSDKEWDILVEFLGGAENAGGALKSTTLWNLPNTGADNISGFSALPSGNRSGYDGTFSNLNKTGFYWSSTEDGSTGAWIRILSSSKASIVRGNGNGVMNDGFCVRCIKDSVVAAIQNTTIGKQSRMYPSITKEVIYFENNSQNDCRIYLFDLYGKKINCYLAKPGMNTFSLGGIKSGYYIARYSFGLELINDKIFKY
jgi:uncharacterized protein (TIGR02145 family)